MSQFAGGNVHTYNDHMRRLSESLNTNEPSQATHAVRNTHASMHPQKAKTNSTFNLLRHPGHVGHQKTMEKYELKCGICTSWLGVKMVKSSISSLISLFLFFHPKYPRPSWLSRRSRWPPARQTPTPRFGTRLQALGFGHGGAVGQGLVQMAILSWGSTPPPRMQ